jgi:hypothetical protein
MEASDVGAREHRQMGMARLGGRICATSAFYSEYVGSVAGSEFWDWYHLAWTPVSQRPVWPGFAFASKQPVKTSCPAKAQGYRRWILPYIARFTVTKTSARARTRSPTR